MAAIQDLCQIGNDQKLISFLCTINYYRLPDDLFAMYIVVHVVKIVGDVSRTL